jgi:hypothetical protein
MKLPQPYDYGSDCLGIIVIIGDCAEKVGDSSAFVRENIAIHSVFGEFLQNSLTCAV